MVYRQRRGAAVSLGAGALALVGLSPATAHAISGSTGAGFFAVLFFVGLQAILGLFLFEVGLGLLLVRPEDRARFGLYMAASAVALFFCLQHLWLGPPCAVLPAVAILWRERRDRAIGLGVAALAISALCKVWISIESLAFACSLTLPALPLGVVLWRDGQKRLATVSLVGFVAGLPVYGYAGAISMQSGSALFSTVVRWLLPALLSAPLAYFVKREGKPRLALGVVIGTMAASLLLDFMMFRILSR